jgi:nitrate reductase (cytochrome), electron transfer subunit
MILSDRMFLIALACAGIALLLMAFDRELTARAGAMVSETPVSRIAAGRPIAAEALVFRTRTGDLATDGPARRRPDAHPRTLATWRALRAYPGAPPPVPHGLTAEELRGTRCNTCHERGGYSARFGAYAPVTPHAEFLACLQCHATDAALAGTALPDTGPDALCRQCHAPAPTTVTAALEWVALEWPRIRGPAPDGTPPEIPHDLQLRGNCLACHAGPGAVSEIRTAHPERANCRQCHTAPVDERPVQARPVARGGTP